MESSLSGLDNPALGRFYFTFLWINARVVELVDTHV